MTDKDRIFVEHIGGPYDAQHQYVPLDEDGNPPEFYILKDFGPYDPSIPPLLGIQQSITHRFYDLDVAVDEDGPRNVYRYRGEDTPDLNKGNPTRYNFDQYDEGQQAA